MPCSELRLLIAALEEDVVKFKAEADFLYANRYPGAQQYFADARLRDTKRSLRDARARLERESQYTA